MKDIFVGWDMNQGTRGKIDKLSHPQFKSLAQGRGNNN